MLRVPGKRLLGELRAVHSASESFVQELEQHNFLPEEFPAGKVKDICETLSALRNGSADQARFILEHSITRLSEIRAKHFEHSDVVNELNDSLPVLERGDHLDRSLALLISAATTALDAYRRDFSRNFVELDRLDFIETISPDLLDVAKDRKIGDAVAELHKFGAALHEDETDQYKNFKMATTDSVTAARATLYEVNSQAPIRRWVSVLSGATITSARLTRRLAASVRVGLNLGKPLYSRWNEMWQESFEFASDQVEKWAIEIEEISAKVERLSTQGKPGEENGITLQMHGANAIVSSSGEVFSCPREERGFKFERIVSFSVDQARVVQSIKYHSFDSFLTADGDVKSSASDMKAIVKKVISKLNKRGKTEPNKAIALHELEIAMKKEVIFPVPFWKGVCSQPTPKGLGQIGLYSSARKADGKIYVSSNPLISDGISIPLMRQLTYDLLNQNGIESIEFSQLQTTFSHLAPIPIKKALGIKSWRQIFENDDRFETNQMSVRLHKML